MLMLFGKLAVTGILVLPLVLLTMQFYLTPPLAQSPLPQL
jgi:hypothetical protein